MLIPMLNPIATLISTKQRWQRRRIVTRICQDMAIERQEKGSQMLPLNKHQQITGGVRVQCLLFYGNLALNLSLDSAGCWFCDVLWIRLLMVRHACGYIQNSMVTPISGYPRIRFHASLYCEKNNNQMSKHDTQSHNFMPVKCRGNCTFLQANQNFTPTQTAPSRS